MASGGHANFQMNVTTRCMGHECEFTWRLHDLCAITRVTDGSVKHEFSLHPECDTKWTLGAYGYNDLVTIDLNTSSTGPTAGPESYIGFLDRKGKFVQPRSSVIHPYFVSDSLCFGLMKLDGYSVTLGDGKVVKSEDGKVVKSEDGKVVKSEDGKVVKSEDGKVVKSEDGKVMKSEDGKVVKSEDGKVVKSEDGKVVAKEDGDTVVVKGEVVVPDCFVRTDIVKNETADVPVDSEKLDIKSDIERKLGREPLGFRFRLGGGETITLEDGMIVDLEDGDTMVVKGKLVVPDCCAKTEIVGVRPGDWSRNPNIYKML